MLTVAALLVSCALLGFCLLRWAGKACAPQKTEAPKVPPFIDFDGEEEWCLTTIARWLHSDDPAAQQRYIDSKRFLSRRR